MGCPAFNTSNRRNVSYCHCRRNSIYSRPYPLSFAEPLLSTYIKRWHRRFQLVSWARMVSTPFRALLYIVIPWSILSYLGVHCYTLLYLLDFIVPCCSLLYLVVPCGTFLGFQDMLHGKASINSVSRNARTSSILAVLILNSQRPSSHCPRLRRHGSVCLLRQA